MVLNHSHGVWVSLTSQGAQDDSPLLGGFRGVDRVTAQGLHLLVLVGLTGQGPGVRVVPICGDGGVVNHG